MLLNDITSIRNSCTTDEERAQIDAAIDVIGDTFMAMVKSFEKKATEGSSELADLAPARKAYRFIREKDTENLLPEIESDGALAVFIIKFARETMGADR